MALHRAFQPLIACRQAEHLSARRTLRSLGIIAVLALLLVNGATVPAASEPDWAVPMTSGTATEGANPNLGFGARNGATDGFDSGIDVPHPPLAPGAEFDAYFSIIDSLYPMLDRDYRTPADLIEWSLYLESGGESITLTWDASAVPADVQLSMSRPDLNIDMRAVGGTILPAGRDHVRILASRTPTPTPTPVPPDWDVDCSGCVDVLDIILVGQRFGETGAPWWTPEDVNGDGVINVLDVIVIGQHFGEGCA